MRTIVICALATLAGCSNNVSVSSDVRLQNATAHVMSQGTCPTSSGSLAPCVSYELTFALLNSASRAIDRVEDVQLSTGGHELQSATAVACAGAPWTLPPSGTSGVVDVAVSFGPSASVSIDCSQYSAGRMTAELLSAPSAAGDSFDLRVEGLLSDAQPFVATAHAPIF